MRLAALLLLLASPALASSAEDTTAVGALRAEAKVAAKLAASAPGKEFLKATGSLPHVSPRVVWVDSSRTHAWTEAEAKALADTTRARLIRREVDEFFYYNTRYGSPLAYLRPIEILAAHGLKKFDGVRLMDFGYGTAGHLRLMASLGADVVGVEVDPSLRALYSQPGDQGKVGKGQLKLVDGQWPATDEVRAAAGGGFDVILSKNTLKRGYIHPERPANPRMLVHLGVDDSTYVARLHDALKPGGYALIYNLSPAPSKPDQPYQPWSDGRCPFERGLLERAGFEVLAYDLDDGPAARALGHALGWDAGPRSMDLQNDLFAHATLLRRPL